MTRSKTTLTEKHDTLIYGSSASASVSASASASASATFGGWPLRATRLAPIDAMLLSVLVLALFNAALALGTPLPCELNFLAL